MKSGIRDQHSFNYHDEENEFYRTLDTWNLTSIGIGAIIGAGIFVLTGQAAANYAGPGITISFILSGFACVFAALCYAEFASLMPVAGSAYSYAYATLGRFFAWIIGWDLILEYLFGASTVAVGWSGYVVSFLSDLGISLPVNLVNAPFNYLPEQGWIVTGALLNLPAMFIVALLTLVLIVGIEGSSRLNNAMVVLKIGVLLVFIFFGIGYISADNWIPFIPENTGQFGQFGWSGIFRGSAVIFFAYIGFDAISTAAQEAKNPQKTLPTAILVSLAVSTILYVAVALVLTGIVPYFNLDVPDPMAVGINAAGEGLFWLRPIIKIGAIAGLTSVILVMILAQPRIFYSMAKDGLLPRMFSQIHPRYNTPHLTTLMTGLVAMLVAGILPIGVLGELVSIGTLLAFIIVCAGVILLRITQPNLHRPFKTPWYPFVPIMGILTGVIQMAALPMDAWIRLVIWLILGLIIYYSYGRRRAPKRKLSPLNQ